MGFRLSIISDEISDDFDRALDLASCWGLPLVELRTLWGKNVVDLTPEEVARTRLALERRGISVECIASPLFKSPLPVRQVDRGDSLDLASQEMRHQMEVLARALRVAKALGARMVRAFSFWRLPWKERRRAEIAQLLRHAAAAAAAEGCVLALENEHSCTASTGSEAGALLNAADSPDCKAIWDPANAHVAGERAFPEGYGALRGRIANVHVKDCVHTTAPDEEPWRLLGQGEIDWRGQLAALVEDGYDGPLTLEPHPIRPYRREESAFRSLVALRRLLAGLDSGRRP